MNEANEIHYKTSAIFHIKKQNGLPTTHEVLFILSFILYTTKNEYKLQSFGSIKNGKRI